MIHLRKRFWIRSATPKNDVLVVDWYSPINFFTFHNALHGAHSDTERANPHPERGTTDDQEQHFLCQVQPAARQLGERNCRPAHLRQVAEKD